jgi:putative redox protein
MTATVLYEGHLRTKCTHTASHNAILTDAPTDNHGLGQAFSPTDLVATALASCMITTMGIKAQLSGINFNASFAEVTKIMAAEPRRIGEINIEIIMPKQLTEKERTILENSAKQCPVAKSLHPDLVQSVHFIYE